MKTALKNNKLRVSIITPVLNLVKSGREKYFRQLMDSIHYQDYDKKYIEHIIIDGASDDQTLDLIEEYSKKGQISIWKSEPDTGVYNAMNIFTLLKGRNYFFGGVIHEIQVGVLRIRSRLKLHDAYHVIQGSTIQIDD